VAGTAAHATRVVGMQKEKEKYLTMVALHFMSMVVKVVWQC